MGALAMSATTVCTSTEETKALRVLLREDLCLKEARGG